MPGRENVDKSVLEEIWFSLSLTNHKTPHRIFQKHSQKDILKEGNHVNDPETGNAAFQLEVQQYSCTGS